MERTADAGGGGDDKKGGGDDKKEGGGAAAVPPISYGSGTRQMAASMGLPPYGMDCCPCLANEEDWRVYPVTPALLQLGEGAPQPPLAHPPLRPPAARHGAPPPLVSSHKVPAQ